MKLALTVGFNASERSFNVCFYAFVLINKHLKLQIILIYNDINSWLGFAADELLYLALSTTTFLSNKIFFFSCSTRRPPEGWNRNLFSIPAHLKHEAQEIENSLSLSNHDSIREYVRSWVFIILLKKFAQWWRVKI